MQALTEFAPLLAFFVAYYLRGLYVATAVLMVAMLVLLAVDWLRTRRIPAMHTVSTVLVVVFGSATLLLHNKLFIQWKPTVFFWLASLAFLGSFWIGDRPLVQRFLGAALGGETQVEASVWRRLNWLWIVFYIFLGFLNLAVAFNASERAWVNFKVIGLTLANFVFVGAQILWLSRRSAAAVQRA